MTKIDLVTGFLGSGKTTFIKKYVAWLLSQGERVGILENDYGAVNVDMLLLRELRNDNCELEMIAGGCDSDCYRRRFKTKLISMAMSGYTRVVMEPSGIFDITDFYDVLREEPLDNWYEIGNVFCIVDAKLDTNQSEEAEYVLKTQLTNSGCVILSRTGIASEVEISRTKEYIDQLGLGNIPIYDRDWNSWGNDDFVRINRAGFKISESPKKYDWDELPFDSIYYLESGLDIEAVKVKSSKLFEAGSEVGNVTRIKGFVPDKASNTWVEINATHKEMSITDIAVGQEVLIVIGEHLDKDKIDEVIGTDTQI